MANDIDLGKISISKDLYDFISNEVLSALAFDQKLFWQNTADFIEKFAAENKVLLQKREDLQQQIDLRYAAQKDKPFNVEEDEEFLRDIGYIIAEKESFQIETNNADDEIARIAGPQLVVPIMNARYALNAANARWGSLYDALYGTDVIAQTNGLEKTADYNPLRGEKVIEWARQFLDEAFPLSGASWFDLAKPITLNENTLCLEVEEGRKVALKDEKQFLGYVGDKGKPNKILLENNGLHIEIVMDDSHPIGKNDPAHIADVILESALSTIMDCEDSVAAVDAEDKILAYTNWLGLMKGDLKDQFEKNGKTVERRLAADRVYTSANGDEISLQGRSLMLVRNVGHLMTTPAIHLANGEEAPEGLMDAIFTSLIALFDLQKKNGERNSRTGSIYIVKPKMHGPEEVAFANRTFDAVEDILSLPRDTIKIGIMDEERRTTVNLKECIRAAKSRVVFINTGFLDRTGDEMHTAMQAGPMLRKADMKATSWINAYEDNNVDIGLACGFKGRAQIGKGMWAMPDLMADMLEQKIGHPKAGANCAWVPSPTAATLHATHYHKILVSDIQEQLISRERAKLSDILTIPVADRVNWQEDEIQNELDNNAQGILGYMVRWVEHGVGCSKVPDINNVGLMEDRATLRISSQHMTNWLTHGICTQEQVIETLKRMAKIVDEQNASDPNYKAMADNFDRSIAFQAAVELVFEGVSQPSGYTEPILHKRRLEFKALS